MDHECQEARDKIYGLLGLTQVAVEVQWRSDTRKALWNYIIKYFVMQQVNTAEPARQIFTRVVLRSVDLWKFAKVLAKMRYERAT